MECQECQKRPATLHFTQVVNGNKIEVHVCEVCAKEKGYMTYPEEGYSFHNLLTGLFNFEPSPMSSHSNSAFTQPKELQCPQCGMSFAEFKRVGKFGCASCYHTFSERLDPILRRVHSGNTKHFGKIPKRQGGDLHAKKQLEDYKVQLKALIDKEEFEEAAEVRDKIKDLEKEMRGDQS
ncbi:protein-arginine kinase activator protein [Lentibacillus populi]|uniref:Protein-arginine kinase activator protein n=1 Tax=Lentibacillus populi TaxID=1827502 RepID=A0A9W5X682_9BACI|nr:UvrB/UvrC motif-containing protein [Lentibacillus populi]MBT2217193.1 UvrB/UvrC motif-containing protein [Virgibacillus dakarensis]GGB49765.1 protein-arginine kinase activator protein [Lentibacillus populi]